MRRILLLVLLLGALCLTGCAGFTESAAPPEATVSSVPTADASAEDPLYDELVAQGETVRTVGEGRMFPSIRAATALAQDGDVILVYPGVYHEAVDVSDKTLRILGTDRDTCILQYPNGDYNRPPLEMASGRLQNLTIHATQQALQPHAAYKAYALHTDFDRSIGETLLVQNVCFINDDHTVVGIGLRDHFTLQFVDCSFICRGDNIAFYCHDDPVYAGSVQQRVMVQNCYLENNGENPTIVLQSQEMPGSQVSCLWQDNTVVNLHAGGGYLVSTFWNPVVHGDGFFGMSFWENESASARNSLWSLNQQ